MFRASPVLEQAVKRRKNVPKACCLDRFWLGNLLSCEVGDCRGGDVALVVSWVFILSLVYVLGNRAPID